MKKFIFIFFLLLTFPLYVVADDYLDSLSGIDRVWDGQKSITNKEFEEAINTLEAKKKQKEAKLRKKKVRKISGGGTSLHSGLSPDSEIKSITPLEEKNKDCLLLNVPVYLMLGDETLDKGYYKIIAERDKNNDIYLLFYQSQFFKGKVRAFETDDDYGKDEIDFVELIPYDKKFMKIIFGSLDFNAYTYIRYKQDDFVINN